MIEASVEDRLVRGVKKRGGEVRKLSWLGRKHAPDRLILWPQFPGRGCHDLVELKRPGKKPRAGQTREIHRLWRAGFNVFVLDTNEKVDNYLAMRT